MHAERLQQLRRVIAAAPEARFVMRRWSMSTSCGTAHCAAGWAAIDDWFRANTKIATIFTVPHDGTITPVSAFTADITSALAQIFDVDYRDAANLFAIEEGAIKHRVRKADVLANVDRLLEGRHASRYRPDRPVTVTDNLPAPGSP